MRLNLIKLQQRTSGIEGKYKVFQMCVPLCVANSLKWKKGDTLTIEKVHDYMKVKKFAKVDGCWLCGSHRGLGKTPNKPEVWLCWKCFNE